MRCDTMRYLTVKWILFHSFVFSTLPTTSVVLSTACDGFKTDENNLLRTKEQQRVFKNSTRTTAQNLSQTTTRVTFLTFHHRQVGDFFVSSHSVLVKRSPCEQLRAENILNENHLLTHWSPVEFGFSLKRTGLCNSCAWSCVWV